jgi:hypothetical protein
MPLYDDSARAGNYLILINLEMPTFSQYVNNGSQLANRKNRIVAIVINIYRLAKEYAAVKIPLSPFHKVGTQLA